MIYPTDAVEVTIPSVDIDLPTLSHLATINSQQDKNIHNVSPISEDIFFQLGPHPIELKQLPTKESPVSPTSSNRRPTQLFKPFDLHNTPLLCNDPEQRQIKAVAQELKQLALHSHSEVQNQTSGYKMCSKPYKQALEEATAEYLQQKAEIGETVHERHLKRHAFIAGLQSGVIAFVPRRVLQATACDGLLHSKNKDKTTQEAQGNFLPLF